MISVEGTEVPPEAEPPPPSEPSSVGGLVVLGAFLLLVFGIVGIAWALFGMLTASEVPATFEQGTPPPITAPQLDEALSPGAIVLAYPTLGEVARYEQGDSIVYLSVRGEVCGRGEGTIGASGVITNASWLRQTYDYVIGVDLIRAWTSAPIAHLETTVEGLSSGDTADWRVEMVSSRVSTINCEITSVTAIPSGS
jgi:hypothetical protein